MITSLVCASFSALCALALVPASDWYVDQSAPNCAAGNGSQGAPFCTLDLALAVAGNGDTIHVAPGTYYVRATISADVTIVGTGGAAATILDGFSSPQNPNSGRVVTVPPGIDVTIRKVLPMGGGLGGGSSDAATALLAANHLWQSGLSREDLMTLALPLGADIPFFLFGENAFAEGVGEALQAVATPDCWYVVIEPGVAVPTPAIFCSDHLTRDTKPVRITDFSRHLDSRTDLSGFGRNDLQAVASSLFAPVAAAIEWLGSYGDARMTGSGACVFCAFSSEGEAEAVVQQLPPAWTAWKARSLRRHPLHGMCK